MDNKYFEEKMESGLKRIENITNELHYLNYTELKDKLWLLERETALLREFIEQEQKEDEYREVI